MRQILFILFIALLCVSAASAVPISASFTKSPSPSSAGGTVNFNDTSIGSPVTWNWSVDGVTLTNSTQNASYRYPAPGVYNVFLNVTNSTGHWSNTSQTQTVANMSGYTKQDIWMEGQYLQTFHITDSSTGFPIVVVHLEDAVMQTYITTNGTGYLTEPFGSTSVVFTSDGYDGKSISYVFDSAATHDVQLTKTAVPPTVPQSIRYVPHLVRFQTKDFGGQGVSGVTVYAQGMSSTASDSWILNLLGLDTTLLPMANTTLTGTTGTDGSVVFMMLETIQYQVNFTSISKGVSEEVTLYPKEDSYLVIVGTSGAGNMSSNYGAGSAAITRVLTANQSGTTLTMNLSYDDPAHQTTAIFFWVEDTDKSPLYNTTYSGYSQNFSFVVDPLTHGGTYTYGYRATHPTYGYISGNSIITTHSRLLAPLEYLGWDTSWYMWATVVCLIFFAALFSGTTSIYGTLLFPFWALFFGFIGWLDWCPWEFLVGVAALGTIAFISRMYSRVGDG